MRTADDSPLSFETARTHPDFLCDGKSPSAVTFWRWMRIGVAGVVLENEMVGGHRTVRPSAIARFKAEVSKRRAFGHSKYKLPVNAIEQAKCAETKQRLARKRERQATSV